MMKRFRYVLTIVTIAGFIGCNTATDSATKTANKSASANGTGSHVHSAEGHAHGVGPHDGTVADWGGGKYHVEFTVDHSNRQATVYILGSDEKTPTSIDAASIELSIKDPEIQLFLQASPQESDAKGKSSRFVGAHEKLGVVQEYTGTITGVVDGTPYSGDFQEEAHDGHDHN